MLAVTNNSKIPYEKKKKRVGDNLTILYLDRQTDENKGVHFLLYTQFTVRHQIPVHAEHRGSNLEKRLPMCLASSP